jgi:hypothetical protein
MDSFNGIIALKSIFEPENVSSQSFVFFNKGISEHNKTSVDYLSAICIAFFLLKNIHPNPTTAPV